MIWINEGITADESCACKSLERALAADLYNVGAWVGFSTLRMWTP